MTDRIKMIGFDLDGTLLTSNKEITDYTREVLVRAIDQGVVVLPATGRPFQGVPKELLEFPGIRYALTANGARVVDLKENKVLRETLMPVWTAREILTIFEKYDTMREIYYDGVGYAEERMFERIGDFFDKAPMTNYILTTRVPVKNVREKFEAENRSVDKMQAIFADVSDKDRALLDLQAVGDIEVTGALTNNIEINAKGVNKGRALVELGAMLGIRREEIMAFGDGDNDIYMMREAGFGVAMANGVDEVRAAADYITVSNDEDGVAKVIEKYVLR